MVELPLSPFHRSLVLLSLQVRQRNELGIYLMNLSVADLLYIATLPLWIDYFLQHDDWIHGQESCKLFGFIFYTNIYVSIAFLCCISIDRYLAVAFPLRFAKVRRIKTGKRRQTLTPCRRQASRGCASPNPPDLT